MSTRSTWPSADLWKRIAAGGIADETICPVCGCPAAGHYRDAVAKVLFCPDPKDAAKLKVMLSRAKAPNPNVAPRERLGLDTTSWAESGRAEAAAEIERLKSVYPDFEELRPYINRIVTTSPDISLETAILKARELLARNQMRENDAAIYQQRAALEAEKRRREQAGRVEADRRYGAPRWDPSGFNGSGFNAEGGELPRATRPAAPDPPKRQTGEITKRQYVFDEE